MMFPYSSVLWTGHFFIISAKHVLLQSQVQPLYNFQNFA
jgi:hypothetical protein